jgi:hypothetical protein
MKFKNLFPQSIPRASLFVRYRIPLQSAVIIADSGMGVKIVPQRLDAVPPAKRPMYWSLSEGKLHSATESRLVVPDEPCVQLPCMIQ